MIGIYFFFLGGGWKMDHIEKQNSLKILENGVQFYILYKNRGYNI